MPECFVARADELKDGDRRIVVSGKHEVGIFCHEGKFYALPQAPHRPHCFQLNGLLSSSPVWAKVNFGL